MVYYLMIAAAECMMAKVVPRFSAAGVDTTSTFANLIGSGLVGALSALEKEVS